MSSRRTTFMAALALSVATGALAQPRHAGYPLIESYSEQVASAGGGSQNYRVVADSRGPVLVSNVNGLMTYDGAAWTLRPVGTSEIVYGVAVDPARGIAVGGNEEFGVFAPDATGTLRYTSLKDRLPKDLGDWGQVGYVHAVPDGFLFYTTLWLAHWNGRDLSVLATYPKADLSGKTFDAGGRVWFWLRERGLTRVDGRALVDVPGGEAFRGRRIDAVLEVPGGLVVSVRSEGLTLLRDGRAEPFAPEASRWTAEGRIRDSCALPDGRLAFGSLRSGLMIMRPDGAIDQVIDTGSGLADNHVQGLAVDREGGLWAALANGLVRIEVGQPLSLIDARNGLRGSVHEVACHGDDLWAATTSGVFTTAGVDATASTVPRMRRLTELPSVGWSVFSDGEYLLIGTYDGLYAIDGGRATLVEGTTNLTTYAMARSKRDASRVWLATSDGLGSIRRAGAGWVFEGIADRSPREPVSVVESAGGSVWVGGSDGAVSRFEVVDGVPKAAGTVAVARGGEVRVSLVDGALVAAVKNELWKLSETGGSPKRFGPAPDAISGRVHAVVTDASGNLWIGGSPPLVVLGASQGKGTSTLTLPSIRVHTIFDVYAERDGAVLLATEHGIVRHEGAPRGTVAPLPRPAFGRITVDGSTVLFGGAPGVAPANGDLAHSARRLRIELAPLSFRRGLRFSSRVEGIDSGWNAPTEAPSVELTQLSPGRYTLHVRTVGPNGEVSPEISWAFVVRRPWYESPIAIVLWVALALLGVRGYGRLRSRRARSRARELQAEVAEKTGELQRTVEELSRTRDELEAANARLEDLSLHDSLTGLHNRRMFDRAIAEEWERARRHRTPIAVILIDIDHFKLLNDTRGHREGDTCLRAIAAYLARAIVRAGDVVARFGGEEFAILLPNTAHAGAVHVAEQLRVGIESLGLPHPSVATGCVTASFGVAATVPDDAALPESLLESADRALYRAKSEGRNRVEG